MRIDLHGYHPAEIVFNGTLAKIFQQAWEMGEDKLTLIHGGKSQHDKRFASWPVRLITRLLSCLLILML